MYSGTTDNSRRQIMLPNLNETLNRMSKDLKTIQIVKEKYEARKCCHFYIFN